MVLHYEEQLMSWEGTISARSELSIRITDGRQRLVTHIRLPAGLAKDAQDTWRQEKREQTLSRFSRLPL